VSVESQQADNVRGIDLPARYRRARSSVPTPVLHLVRAGARRYGQATAPQRPLPDFLIIGAKKAGTSSLMNWLLQHQAISRMFPAAQRLKSPHYFDVNYWRTESWYASHFPTRATRRRQEERVGSLTMVGEASPYYMFHPAVPARVAATLPDARVIVLLRDPVARAYSNYWDRHAFGTEKLASFEEAIDAEPQRLATVDASRLMTDPKYYSEHHDHHTYLARGRYAEHLQPWLELVPSNNLLVLRAEDLFQSPVETFADVQRFLRVPVVTDVALRRYNKRGQPPIQPSTRARLADYYRPYNAELYALLGRDLGWESEYPPPAGR
jgi:hypothetical protein